MMFVCYLDVDNVATLVDFHVSGERDDTILSEWSSEQVSGTTSVTIGVDHLASMNTILNSNVKQKNNNKSNMFWLNRVV